MKRILAIEDEADLADLLAHLLRYRGYAVEVAYGGSEGLVKLEAGAFDLVLTDLMMPQVSGWHVIEAIERSDEHRDIPVIVMSAAGSPSTTRLGGRPFVAKPFAFDTLLATIEALIGAPDP